MNDETKVDNYFKSEHITLGCAMTKPSSPQHFSPAQKKVFIKDKMLQVMNGDIDTHEIKSILNFALSDDLTRPDENNHDYTKQEDHDHHHSSPLERIATKQKSASMSNLGSKQQSKSSSPKKSPNSTRPKASSCGNLGCQIRDGIEKIAEGCTDIEKLTSLPDEFDSAADDVSSSMKKAQRNAWRDRNHKNQRHEQGLDEAGPEENNDDDSHDNNKKLTSLPSEFRRSDRSLKKAQRNSYRERNHYHVDKGTSRPPRKASAEDYDHANNSQKELSDLPGEFEAAGVTSPKRVQQKNARRGERVHHAVDKRPSGHPRSVEESPMSSNSHRHVDGNDNGSSSPRKNSSSSSPRKCLDGNSPKKQHRRGSLKKLGSGRRNSALSPRRNLETVSLHSNDTQTTHPCSVTSNDTIRSSLKKGSSSRRGNLSVRFSDQESIEEISKLAKTMSPKSKQSNRSSSSSSSLRRKLQQESGDPQQNGKVRDDNNNNEPTKMIEWNLSPTVSPTSSSPRKSRLQRKSFGKDLLSRQISRVDLDNENVVTDERSDDGTWNDEDQSFKSLPTWQKRRISSLHLLDSED